jgi:anaphase-promoting complex subunit 1
MALHIPAALLQIGTDKISDSLQIDNDTVLWFRGGTVFQQFRYPGQAITRALFVEFADQSPKLDPKAVAKCAIIIVADTAYIYDINGPSYQINLPFAVQRAESYGSGLILERSLQSHKETRLLTKFFTLSDTILDLGIVASSSVSAISSDEELLFVGNAPNSSIYLTNDPVTQMVHFYHARYLSTRTSGSDSKRKSSSRRKSSIARPALENSVEEGNVDLDALGTVRDSAYSLHRLGDSAGRPESSEAFQSIHHLASLRKDVILTHLAKFNINATTSDLKVLAVSDAEKEVLAILNRRNFRASLHTFKKASGPIGLPSIDSSQSFEIRDIAIAGNNIFFMLSEDGKLSLFHPLLNIRSPEIRAPPILSILSSYLDSSISVETAEGVLTFQLKFKATSEIVEMCFNSLDLLLDPLSSQYLKFLWASALFLGNSEDEWIPFVAIILSSLLEYKESLDLTISNHSGRERLSNSWSWLEEGGIVEQTYALVEALKIAKVLSKSEFGSQFDFSEIKQYIIFALHLVREEYKLQVSCYEHVRKLGTLLGWLVKQADWSDDWVQYYESEVSSPVKGKLSIRWPYILLSIFLTRTFDSMPRTYANPSKHI